MKVAAALPLAFTVLLSACGRDSTAEHGTAAIPGAPLEIRELPAISVGVASGDPMQELDQVVTPFLLGDGRLVVPVAGSSSVRVFASDGSFLTSLGRSGNGPGEFRSITAAWSRGDTIEAFDSRLNRVTRFLPGGSTEVVSLRVQIPDLSWGGGPASGGWMLGGVATGGSNGRDVMAILVFGEDGVQVAELPRSQGMARYEAQGSRGPEPLSPRALLAVHEGHAYVAQSEIPRIQVFDATGALTREISWTPDPGPAARDIFQMVVDSAVARAAPEQAVATRLRLEAAPVPEQLSVFWKFIVDQEGFIWIRPYDPMKHAAARGGLGRAGVGPGGRWMILSPEGVEVGFIDVPGSIEPMQITSDAIVGIHRDPLGVESVRVLRLSRR